MCGEALANIAKHAGASAASIAVQRSRELVSVIVSDDGAGGAVTGGGTGLVGLRERVTRLGGSLEIDSPVGRGTRLTARLPVTQG